MLPARLQLEHLTFAASAHLFPPIIFLPLFNTYLPSPHPNLPLRNVHPNSFHHNVALSVLVSRIIVESLGRRLVVAKLNSSLLRAAILAAAYSLPRAELRLSHHVGNRGFISSAGTSTSGCRATGSTIVYTVECYYSSTTNR